MKIIGRAATMSSSPCVLQNYIWMNIAVEKFASLPINIPFLDEVKATPSVVFVESSQGN